MNTEGAPEIIEMLCRHMKGKMHIGAGTVTTPERKRTAQAAGAAFIVMPNLEESVVADCIKHGLPVFPGVLTPTEICRAMDLGCSYVKLFPAGAVPSAYVKDVLSSLSEVKALVVGGVNSQNFGEYLRNGATGAGIGGSLCKVPPDNDYTLITLESQTLINIYAEHIGGTLESGAIWGTI